MYQQLQSRLQKPAIYEKTAHKFWDDPHISKGMLQAHLSPETDAASRRPETIRRSVDWLAGLLPNGAALLDLGCGPGLYTKLFTQKGFRVTGVDLSARSLNWAREHDPDTDYLQFNYLDMEFEAAFDAATLIWCDYGALVKEDRKALLRKVNQALKPGGLFILDVFTPARYEGFKEITSWQNCPGGGFWSDKPHLLISLDACYDGPISLSRHVVIEEDAIRDYNIWDTTFTKKPLTDEMSAFGFTPQGFYADMEGHPFSPESQTLCAVMRKAAR